VSSLRNVVPIGALVLVSAMGAGCGTSALAGKNSPSHPAGKTDGRVLNQAAVTSVQDAYINRVAPFAQEMRREYNGVPASVAIAQSAIESRWGGSRLTVNDRNFFGFKCVAANQPGPIASGCHDYVTHEDNPPRDIHAYFRVYASDGNSFRDYGRLMNTPGYAAALQFKNDPNRFIQTVAPRYSTNPNYANSVIATMRAHNLYRFDNGAPAPPPPPPGSGGGKVWVNTYAPATGYSGAGTGRPQGVLNKGRNYVYCRVWGAQVGKGSQFNHWWLRTDLDRTYSGGNGRGAYVSAFYLSRWGNDQAKDVNGTDIPNC
jgi:hypothetical protein